MRQQSSASAQHRHTTEAWLLQVALHHRSQPGTHLKPVCYQQLWERPILEVSAFKDFLQVGRTQYSPPLCPASLTGLLISSTHGNITTAHEPKSTTDVLEYTHHVQPGLSGLTEKRSNSQLLTSTPQSQRHGKELHPKASRKLILWSQSAYIPKSYPQLLQQL